MPYFFKIPKNGNNIIFIRTHPTPMEDYWWEINVFDTLGNEIAYTTHKSYTMEGSPPDYEVSPDGKIIGAIVYPNSEGPSRNIRHLFFFDVESGRTKLVKAEGEGWEASGFPVNDRKIYLTIHKYPKSYILSFDEIPSDLSSLFEEQE